MSIALVMKIKGVFRTYKTVLDRHPYFMEAIQTGLLMGSGDLLSQTLIEKKAMKEIDVKRTLQFSSIGLFFGGPALRFWYGFLHKYVGSKGKSVVLKKVLVDQAIFAPTFILFFFVAFGTLQGKNLDIIRNDVEANYIDVLKTNYYTWPLVQLVNFYYVPLQYQVLFVQSVALFWNTYLSWKTNNLKNI